MKKSVFLATLAVLGAMGPATSDGGSEVPISEGAVVGEPRSEEVRDLQDDLDCYYCKFPASMRCILSGHVYCWSHGCSKVVGICAHCCGNEHGHTISWGRCQGPQCYYDGAEATLRCRSCDRRFCPTHQCALTTDICTNCCGNNHGHSISSGRCQGLRCYYEGVEAVAKCGSCGRWFCSTHKCKMRSDYCTHCCGNYSDHKISSYGQCEGKKRE